MNSQAELRHLGDFEIVREIGRGGMGVVYEATQKSLNRRVALKVLSTGLGLTAKAVKRFKREAEAAAKLHHTNIVPIYFTGEENHVPYYVMELVDGPSLDQIIRHMREGDGEEIAKDDCDSTDDPVPTPLPAWVTKTIAYKQPKSSPVASTVQPDSKLSDSDNASGTKYFDRVAMIMAEVADALQHAHDHGVIHRDAKPSNLLLAPDGRLSVNDFGLARVLEQPGMTMSGEFVGTPRYMSPELISAGRARLDHRTDIYSLGATLYELLTLHPPFPGETRDVVIGQILHKEPRSPRRLNKNIPADLETICLKAIDRDPDRRYQTSKQLADDLRAYVNRHAISARRTGPVGRAVKWSRRNPIVFVLLLLLVLMAATTCGLLYRNRVDRLVQIEHAQDALLLDVFNDDFDRARRQLNTARRLGAADAQLAIMKAQIDLIEEKHTQVVIDLERIGRESDNSTAAFAMLTIAYMETGREADCYRRLPDLIRRPAPTYHDRLLRGWAETWLFPNHAVPDLEDAVRLRKSNVASLLLANALVWRALSSPDGDSAIQDARRALDIIYAVRQLTTKEKPWIEALLVLATLVETDFVATNHGDRVRRLQKIQQNVKWLKQWSSVSEWASSSRTCYLQRCDRMAELFADFQAEQSPKSAYAHVYHVIELFRAHRDKDAANAFQRIPSPLRNNVDHMQTYIEMSLPNADNDLISAEFLAARRLLTRDSQAMIYRHFDIWALQLLGKAEEAKQFAKESRQATKDLEDYWPHFQVGNLVGSACTPEELLEACSRDREASVHAYFALGVNSLAEGDWDAAKLQFESALRTNRFPNYVYSWSAAFLQRMDDDPNWLPWLRRNR